MGVLGPGEFERERDSLGSRPRDEGRHRAFCLGVDSGLLRHLQHARQQRGLGEGGKVARDLGGRRARQAAHLPLKLAMLGHDVGRRAAFDGADAYGRVGRLEARVVLPRGDVGAEPLELADQGRGGGDGVDPDIGHARMRLAAGDPRAVGVDALMRVDHPHAGRLADDDGAGPRQVARQAARSAAARRCSPPPRHTRR